MKPPENMPEKIWVMRLAEKYGSGLAIFNKPNDKSFEYHLAQWHDAKTDPPKEKGVYAVNWYGVGGYWEKGEWSNGEWWDFVENEKYNPQPDFYYALPEPPKENK